MTCFLGGRAALRLCLQLEELKLLLLPVMFARILLHRLVQVGLALGEQTFQGLLG